MVTIFGDSLTGNRFGISYRNFLSGDFVFRGIDGQDSLQLLQRASQMLARNPGSGPVLIEGGGNDILDICRAWGCLPERKPEKENTSYEEYQDWALKDSVCTHVTAFLEGQGFEGILEPVLQREAEFARGAARLGCTVWVCSVTVLTEDPDSLYNRLAREWNTALARDIGESFIDITTPLLPLCTGTRNILGGNLDQLLEDRDFIGGSEEKAALLSEKRHLGATVDGIHLNAIGARAVAETIFSKHLA